MQRKIALSMGLVDYIGRDRSETSIDAYAIFFMTPAIAVLALVSSAIIVAMAAVPKPYRPESRTSVAYLAGGREDEDRRDTNWGKMLTFPQNLEGQEYGSSGRVSIVALPKESRKFGRKYAGFRLLVVNRSDAEFEIEACDARLPLICEALDPTGQWRSIESLPIAFCGNSYRDVHLPSGSYWEFSAPCYSGEFKTSLRFKLNAVTPIYSNEFEGTIQLAQFDLSLEEEILQQQGIEID